MYNKTKHLGQKGDRCFYTLKVLVFLNDRWRARKRVQLLRELAAFAEDLGTVPITHTAAHSHLELQLQAIRSPLPTSTGTKHAHAAHTSMQNIHTRKINLFYSKIAGDMYIYFHSHLRSTKMCLKEFLKTRETIEKGEE